MSLYISNFSEGLIQLDPVKKRKNEKKCKKKPPYEIKSYEGDMFSLCCFYSIIISFKKQINYKLIDFLAVQFYPLGQIL